MNNQLLAQIASLENMPIGPLKQLWYDLYKTDAPPFNRRYLTDRLIYRLQELAWDGDTDLLNKRMSAMLKTRLSEDGKSARKQKVYRPPVGTKLTRVYKNLEYHVTVLNDGFAFEGRKYKSLSRIAHIITGMSWSGPDFFGMKQQKARL